MINYNNHNITGISYNNHSIKYVYGCGGNLVWSGDTPTPPTPTNYRYEYTYLNNTTGRSECDDCTHPTSCNIFSSANYAEPTRGAEEYVKSLVFGSCIDSYSMATNYGMPKYYNIQSIDFSNCGVLTITSDTFMNFASLSSVTLNSSTAWIGSRAFYGCTSLHNIAIPNTLTEIGSNAFYGCTALESITLGSNVRKIDAGAFNGCTSLSSITINTEWNIPPITLGSGAFDNTNNCPIYVPSNSVEAYKTTTGWSDYASRIQAMP